MQRERRSEKDDALGSPLLPGDHPVLDVLVDGSWDDVLAVELILAPVRAAFHYHRSLERQCPGEQMYNGLPQCRGVSCSRRSLASRLAGPDFCD